MSDIVFDTVEQINAVEFLKLRPNFEPSSANKRLLVDSLLRLSLPRPWTIEHLTQAWDAIAGVASSAAAPDIGRLIMEGVSNARQDDEAPARQRLDAVIAGGEYTDEQVFTDCAVISTPDYDRRRKAVAERLDIRATTLDEQVERRRARVAGDDDAQGEAIAINNPDPWGESVDGEALLNELVALLKRYIYFSHDDHSRIVALYILATHCFDNFSIFPFLGISAPAENSGKTTLEKCVLRLAPRAVQTNNVTPAALFRLIEMYKPTLLIDEMDTFLNPDSELYGILNSGHDREMAFVTRTVGEGHEPRNFSTWCPRVWAMIGLPKRTVITRSHVIRLQRKPEDVTLEPLPRATRLGPEWKRLGQQCARWAHDHQQQLAVYELHSTGLANRDADNWEPFMAISSIAGGTWPELVQKACRGSGVLTEDEQNIILLRDVRNIFATREVDRLPCIVLAADLNEQVESPWSRFDHGNPVSVHQIGLLMTGLGVRSKPVKLTKQLELPLRLPIEWQGRTVRGFELGQFTTLFKGYLNGEVPEKVKVGRLPWEVETFRMQEMKKKFKEDVLQTPF